MIDQINKLKDQCRDINSIIDTLYQLSPKEMTNDYNIKYKAVEQAIELRKKSYENLTSLIECMEKEERLAIEQSKKLAWYLEYTKRDKEQGIL